MRTQTILVYVDTRTARPLRRATDCIAQLAALAAPHGGRIIVCDAVSLPGGNGARAELEDRLVELRCGFATDTLKALVAGIGSQSDIEIVVFKGKPLIGIVQLVVARKVDLVACIPSVSAAGGLDSTTLHLLRKCPGAVWVMREPPRDTPRKIAVAVDRDIFPASEHPRAMAQQLLDAAVTAARPSLAELHLVHAWEVYGAELLVGLGNELDAEEIQRYRESQRYAHTIWLQELHAQLRSRLAAAGVEAVHSEVHLIEGAPGEALPPWLALLGADLMVLGTLGSSAVPGLLIGTNAETIIMSTDIPVLALKPSGFRSPLAAGKQVA